MTVKLQGHTLKSVALRPVASMLPKTLLETETQELPQTHSQNQHFSKIPGWLKVEKDDFKTTES